MMNADDWIYFMFEPFMSPLCPEVIFLPDYVIVRTHVRTLT